MAVSTPDLNTLFVCYHDFLLTSYPEDLDLFTPSLESHKTIVATNSSHRKLKTSVSGNKQ